MIKKVVVWVVIILVAVQVLVGAFFYFFQFRLLFQATSLPRSYVFEFDQPFEEVFIKAGKSQIHGLYFKSQARKGCVVYFHGNADNLSRWGTIAPDFTEKGFDLLIVDYPTFGKSTGALNQNSLLEMGRKVYGYALKFYPQEKIVLYGRSMGTGIASKVAAENNPKLVILETPYLNIKELVDHHAPRFTPTSLILRLSLNNKENVKKIKAPVYIFHGTEDEIIPFNQAEELARYLKETDRFIIIKGGTHRNLNDYPQFHEELKNALSLIPSR
ncbi:MAG TPA: alpha/beta fold hydrolase [Cytophagales bacterium]|nr:alpha/beta fold hydrolase [Cytophagales bacterium]